MLPHFVLSHLGGATSPRSVAILVLPHFVLSHLGSATSLRSVAILVLPHFVLSHLGGATSLRSVALSLPRFAQSLSIQWFHQIGKWSRTLITKNSKENSHTKIPTYWKMVLYPHNKKFQRKFPHKNSYILENGLVPSCSILLTLILLLFLALSNRYRPRSHDAGMT